MKGKSRSKGRGRECGKVGKSRKEEQLIGEEYELVQHSATFIDCSCYFMSLVDNNCFEHCRTISPLTQFTKSRLDIWL